jgi:outer membrane protein assembly factor BamB
MRSTCHAAQNDGLGGIRPPGAGSWLILWLLAAPVLAGEERPQGSSGMGTAPSAIAEATADGLIASPDHPSGGARAWPQWRGPRRDGISRETGLLPSWPVGGPRLLWKVDGLGTGWSSPIVVDRRLYLTGDVGDDLLIFAFDSDGAPLWRTKNGRAWKGPYPGARACCAFSKGRLYHMNAHGRVACLDATSGNELWAVDILDRFDASNITWALSECLLVDGPRVIVTPGGRKALMAALDTQTGQPVWTTEPLGADRTSHCSPILLRYAGRRLIVNCSSAHGFGVDADTGELLWTVPLRNEFGVNVATPVYGSGSVFFVTPYAEHGRLYRLRASAQGIAAEHVWTCPLDTVTGGAVLLGGTLFAAGYKRSKWWFGIDWRTGRTLCQLKGLTTGAAIYADGRLYVLDESGTVGLLKPGPGTLEIVSRFRLSAQPLHDAWAHPVLCNGRLYLRYHGTLWCYDVKQR